MSEIDPVVQKIIDLERKQADAAFELAHSQNNGITARKIVGLTAVKDTIT